MTIVKRVVLVLKLKMAEKEKGVTPQWDYLGRSEDGEVQLGCEGRSQPRENVVLRATTGHQAAFLLPCPSCECIEQHLPKAFVPKGSLSAPGALGRRLRVLASWGYGMARMASWVVNPQEGRSEHPWGGRVPNSRAGTGPWTPSQQSVLSRKQIRSPLWQGACSWKLITSGGLGSFPAFVGSQSLQVYSFSECAW